MQLSLLRDVETREKKAVTTVSLQATKRQCLSVYFGISAGEGC